MVSAATGSQPVQQILDREDVALRVLTRSDIADIAISPSEVMELVRALICEWPMVHLGRRRKS